jgi:hypothetical protein
MAVHKILVEINGETKATETEVNDEQKPTEPKKPKELGAKGIANAIKGAAYFSMARQLTLGSIARIGSATGDYYTQNQINNVMGLATYGFAIATGGVAGAVYTAVDLGFKVYDFNLQKQKTDIQTNLYRQQIGLAAVSGSRYKGRKI